MSGCCADKACTAETCMSLPEGETCGKCVHMLRCHRLFGAHPNDDSCDWFPRRFVPRAAPPSVQPVAGPPVATEAPGTEAPAKSEVSDD